MTISRLLLICLAAGMLAACSSPRKGAYYQDDGPPARVAASLDRTPDAVPRIEPLARGANQPYVIKGQRYVPDVSNKPYRVRGIASWYGTKFHGKKTANGDIYDMYAMTAAHPTLPIPSYVRVTRVATGRSVVVRINDRGPFHNGRIIDLSYAAAYKLGLHMLGSDEVIVERILPEPHQPAHASAPTPVPASGPAKASSPPAPARVAARTEAGAVYLQMGAFRQADNARALASRLTNSLGSTPNSPPVSVRQHPDQLYHVRVGPYGSREAARNAARTLDEQTGIKSILITP